LTRVSLDPGHLHAQGKPLPLPELIYICPMVQDSDIAEAKPGKCKKCGMELVAARIGQGFTCINHEAILTETGGICPIDRRELVSVAVSVYFTCKSKPDDKLMEPGKCTDGSPRARALEKRPHADHNPRHGGLLFMADTGWHHVEGTYPSNGLFRVYFYDELTKPMPVKGFTARAIVTDQAGKELETVALKPGKITNTLEGTVKSRLMPLQIGLKVKFKPDDKERPFDFTFDKLTVEPKAPAAVMTANKPAAAPGKTAPAPATTTLAATTAQATTAQAPPVAAQPPAIQAPGATTTLPGGGTIESMPSKVRFPLQIPGTTKELLAMLKEYVTKIQDYLNEGQMLAIWEPALNAKDVALGLDDHKGELPESRRPRVSAAVGQIVRKAWEMDIISELGDKQKVMTAHQQFVAAVAELESAYAQR
jgi:hypothetical protein